ncbi:MULTISPECIES: alpha/beta hydrolase [Roseovarius]|jgi:acetyl esterase|uniref:alpha/beta hydrolase n=1 Tax=Roseovarius TaxID=74030 RepID=UPI00273E7481|nr:MULTISPECIES: alpha/beta hydrolase [unclassified Roseovarius]
MLSKASSAVLDYRIAEGLGPFEAYSVAEARVMVERKMPGLTDPAECWADGVVQRLGPDGDVAGLLFRPYAGDAAGGALPVVVYVHGGGWVFGELASHRLLCARMAAGANCAVLSVDYRLAPENRCPAQLEDCQRAISWVVKNGPAMGLDPSRMFLAGDSAGAGLAAAMAAEKSGAGAGCPAPLGQILIYPALDQAGAYPSHRIEEPGMALTGRTMEWFRDHYFHADTDRADPAVSPLRGGLEGPPALVITAGYDPLRDEGASYVRLRRERGMETANCVHLHYPGELHGFMTVTPDSPAAADALTGVLRFINNQTGVT